MVYKFSARKARLVLDKDDIPIGLNWSCRYKGHTTFFLKMFDDKIKYAECSGDAINLRLQKLPEKDVSAFWDKEIKVNMMNTFKVGTHVTAVRHIKFMDNTEHIPGVILTITERDLAYYESQFRDYKIVKVG